MTTVYTLADKYYLSHDFKNLRDETKAQYKYFMSVFLSTEIDGTCIGDMRYAKVTTKRAKLCYDMWCDRGISFANHIMGVARILFNFALRMEHTTINPFSTVRRRATDRRKTVWSREHVKTFLDVAYSDFKTRNIGLIAHMAYAWCQELVGMHLPLV